MRPVVILSSLMLLALSFACSSGSTTAPEDVSSDALCFCSTNADCDDGNPCTVDSCTANCQCAYQDLDDGTDCEPSGGCLLPGTCQSGICVSPGNVECNETDGNPCTVPECNPAAGDGESVCTEVALADGEIVTGYCAQWVCSGGQVKETLPTQAAVDCEAANEAIDPKGCTQEKVCSDVEKACVTVTKMDGTPCKQGTDKCLGFACVEGECIADTELDVVCEPPTECNDQSCLSCTEFKCDPKDGACKAHPLEGTCDDGNFCTVDDACDEASNPMYGECKGTPKACDDGKVCTVDSCDPTDGHCVNAPKDENCPGSNNACVSQVFCDPFAGEGADPNQDGCIVIYKPVDTPCNDNDACTTNDTCVEQNELIFCLGEPLDIDDSNPCTNDSCDPDTGPQHDPIPDCDAPCNPGEQLEGDCGNCGIHVKICPDSGKWADAPWGDCTNQGVCTAGAAETDDCGNCGTKQRICQDNCTWSAWSDCANEGECSAGESEFEACGGQCMTKQRTCNSECQWGPWGECLQQGECIPGQTEWDDCGMCGTQNRNCTEGCVWGPWSNCQNQGLCWPGETKNQNCGMNGIQTATCGNDCFWGVWSQCVEQCECFGGTCCSNGCDYDPYGTSCGTCKQCNGNGSCVNVPNGTNCSGGECYNGSCIECMGDDELDCDPNCGVFNSMGEGEKDCVNNQWDDTCKPVWCKDSAFGEVHYQMAPMDHDWHCAYNDNIGIYLCVKIYLSWICADYLEVDLMKSNNVYGTAETGPWDNDIKVTLRNTSNGKSYTQDKVACAGNTSDQGGCFFDVGTTGWVSTLGLNGTDNFVVDIYSPWTSNEVIGTTGTVKVEKCY